MDRLSSDGKPLFLFGRELLFRRGAKLNSVALRIPSSVLKSIDIDIEDGETQIMFLKRNGQLIILIDGKVTK